MLLHYVPIFALTFLKHQFEVRIENYFFKYVKFVFKPLLQQATTNKKICFSLTLRDMLL